MSVVAGTLIVVRLPWAVLPAAGVIAFGVVASALRRPAAVAVLVCALAISASVDLVGRFAAGPTTVYAWVTAALFGVLLLIVVGEPAEEGAKPARLVLFVSLFPIYAVLSLAWYHATLAGVQNILVYACFALVFVVALRASIVGDVTFELLRTVLFWAYSGAACLYGVGLAIGGLGSGVVIGSRSYALFALTGIAWGAALARFGYRREAYLAGISLLLVLLSLSRLAFAAALLILLFASLDGRTAGRLNRSLVLVALVVAAGYSTVALFSPFTERFSVGDITNVAGAVSLNVEGRAALWSITWESAKKSPVFGGGAGSSEAVIAQRLGRANHPHNDYLRLFHDFGAVGLSLFIMAILTLLWSAWRAFSSNASSVYGALHLAALFEIVALCTAMTTDNAIVYLFFVIPVGLVVGASAGLAHRNRRSLAATRPLESGLRRSEPAL